MKAAEKQRLQKRMAELRADRDRLAELLELKDRQLAECRAEATHYEHRASIIKLSNNFCTAFYVKIMANSVSLQTIRRSYQCRREKSV